MPFMVICYLFISVYIHIFNIMAKYKIFFIVCIYRVLFSVHSQE